MAAATFGMIRILLHKQLGQPMAGLDLAEFARQIDDALREAYLNPTLSLNKGNEHKNKRSKSGPLAISSLQGRVSLASVDRMAEAATTVYLQHLNLQGSARAALKRAWLSLVNEIRQMRSIPLASVLSLQPAAARDLGQRLGKKVNFDLAVESVAVSPTIASVIELTVTHAVTNAIDHGIESPSQRQERGKSELGMIRVSGTMQGDRVEVVVEDDGAGVDFDAVRQRAIALGLLRPDQADQISETAMLSLLLHPNFSTKVSATETSGRGVGLDAVRTALNRHEGRIRIVSKRGQGTRLVMILPQERQEIPVHFFYGGSSDIRLAVSTAWNATMEMPTQMPPSNPLALLGILPKDPPLPHPFAETRTLSLQCNSIDLLLPISGKLSSEVAERICPTNEDFVAEVILLRDGEAILLRPELLIPKPESSAKAAVH
jgi:signal transduction histidine kinase